MQVPREVDPTQAELRKNLSGDLVPTTKLPPLEAIERRSYR